MVWGLGNRKTWARTPKSTPGSSVLLKITTAGICRCIYHSRLGRFAWAHPAAQVEAPQAPPMLGGSPKPSSTPPRSLLVTLCPLHHPRQLLSRDLPMGLPQHLGPFCLGTPYGPNQPPLAPPNVRWATQTHKGTTPITFGQPVYPLHHPSQCCQQGFAHRRLPKPHQMWHSFAPSRIILVLMGCIGSTLMLGGLGFLFLKLG